jgi:molybdopterin synthase sulfur carrier subunit
VASVLVKLSASLMFPAGQADVECQGSTVREVIEDCCASRAQLAGRLFSDDGKQLVGIFLNGRSIRQLSGLDSPVSDGDEIRFLPPIAGG